MLFSVEIEFFRTKNCSSPGTYLGSHWYVVDSQPYSQALSPLLSLLAKGGNLRTRLVDFLVSSLLDLFFFCRTILAFYLVSLSRPCIDRKHAVDVREGNEEFLCDRRVETEYGWRS